MSTFWAAGFIGCGVTGAIHLGYFNRFWCARLGTTVFRRGDLPVGASIVALIACAQNVLGHEVAAHRASEAALGLLLGVTVMALYDPLPRVSR